MAEIDLVQCAETLSVIDLGRYQRPSFDTGPSLHQSSEQSLDLGRFVRDQHAVVAIGLGIDADHRLGDDVFGDVGNQPVLTDDDDDVLGIEQVSVEVGTFHAASPDRPRLVARLPGAQAGPGQLEQRPEQPPCQLLPCRRAWCGRPALGH
jgi:hypothetical protein